MTVPAVTPLDLAAIRADFPLLAQEVNGHPLAYLDEYGRLYWTKRVKFEFRRLDLQMPIREDPEMRTS